MLEPSTVTFKHAWAIMHQLLRSTTLGPPRATNCYVQPCLGHQLDNYVQPYLSHQMLRSTTLGPSTVTFNHAWAIKSSQSSKAARPERRTRAAVAAWAVRAFRVVWVCVNGLRGRDTREHGTRARTRERHEGATYKYFSQHIMWGWGRSREPPRR
eukprot:3594318-Prymnesium_polylepis.1